MKILKEEYMDFNCKYCGKHMLHQISENTCRCDNCMAEYECLPDDYEPSMVEDTEKIKANKWTNRGKDGTHGFFKTKKEADAQRRAMFANGYKGEAFGGINEAKGFTVIDIETKEPVHTFNMRAAADEFVKTLGSDHYDIIEGLLDRQVKEASFSEAVDETSGKTLNDIINDYKEEIFDDESKASDRRYFMNNKQVDRNIFYDALVNASATTDEMLDLEDEKEVIIKGIKYRIEK